MESEKHAFHQWRLKSSWISGLTHTFLQFSLAIDINHKTKVNIRLEKYNLDREKRKKGRVVLNSQIFAVQKPFL